VSGTIALQATLRFANMRLAAEAVGSSRERLAAGSLNCVPHADVHHGTNQTLEANPPFSYCDTEVRQI
jgi:hypothetical protein